MSEEFPKGTATSSTTSSRGSTEQEATTLEGNARNGLALALKFSASPTLALRHRQLSPPARLTNTASLPIKYHHYGCSGSQGSVGTAPERTYSTDCADGWRRRPAKRSLRWTRRPGACRWRNLGGQQCAVQRCVHLYLRSYGPEGCNWNQAMLTYDS